MKRTWVILGAASIIANEFCHLVASAGHDLILVGRNTLQLDVVADDLMLRHKVNCEVLTVDLSSDFSLVIERLQRAEQTFSLFIAHSAVIDNNQLNAAAIETIIKTNVLSTVQLIHAYLHKWQKSHQLIFLSSVAACRGRAKNSLYGGSKAAIEVYLQGLQQTASNKTVIAIARLGFIDTIQTYGAEGIFYASSPKQCARACWKALKKKKRLIYHPFFWRYIMAVICCLPFFIFRRIKR